MLRGFTKPREISELSGALPGGAGEVVGELEAVVHERAELRAGREAVLDEPAVEEVDEIGAAEAAVAARDHVAEEHGHDVGAGPARDRVGVAVELAVRDV